jgi:hypothetical protein
VSLNKKLRVIAVNSDAELDATLASMSRTDFDAVTVSSGPFFYSRRERAPVGTPWMWTLLFGQHEDRTPTHGHEATREAAMAAFAKSWRRE